VLIRRLAGGVYRGLAAPFGLRALERMLRDGLPPRLGEPLRFLFSGECSATARDASVRIEELRANIAARSDRFDFTYTPTPLGMARWLETNERGPISCRRLAEVASVSRRWGTFLHLCAEAFEARTILEMGACVGISGVYLASASSAPRLVTIDGSPALAPIARETIAAVSPRATLIQEPFESGLDRALALVEGIDVAFIDGHHDELATLHYVQAMAPFLSSEALVILDDIHLYVEMWRAWERLRSMPGVAAAVNTGCFGLLVWDGSATVARHYDLARYTGWWPVGRSRHETISPRPSQR